MFKEQIPIVNTADLRYAMVSSKYIFYQKVTIHNYFRWIYNQTKTTVIVSSSQQTTSNTADD